MTTSCLLMSFESTTLYCRIGDVAFFLTLKSPYFLFCMLLDAMSYNVQVVWVAVETVLCVFYAVLSIEYFESGFLKGFIILEYL